MTNTTIPELVASTFDPTRIYLVERTETGADGRTRTYLQHADGETLAYTPVDLATFFRPVELPANAVNEDQFVDMLCGMGVYHDVVYAALYRLRTRTRTVIARGSQAFHCERLAPGIFVALAVPTASLR